MNKVTVADIETYMGSPWFVGGKEDEIAGLEIFLVNRCPGGELFSGSAGNLHPILLHNILGKTGTVEFSRTFCAPDIRRTHVFFGGSDDRVAGRIA